MNIKHYLPLLLSYSRIFAAPFLVWLLIHEYWLAAFILFTAASITDWMDGMWARRFNATTAHGAYIDPLADKILILSVLGTFVYLKSLSLLFFLIIGGREIVITFLRSWCEMKGKKFITAWHGKYKTVLQMILIYSLFAYHLSFFPHTVVMVIAAIVSTYSLFSGMLYCYGTYKDLKS